MNGVLAVAARELRALVRQPVAWTVTAIFLFLHGLFFVQLMERYSDGSLRIITGAAATDFTLVDRVVRPLLVGDAFVLMMLLPALTMRQMAEEWRSGTSDLLLTYPLSETQVVLGKYLGTAAVTTVMILLASLHSASTALFGTVEVPVALLGHFGLWLYAMMVLAAGLSMSTLTDNQVIAFASTLMILLALVVIGGWGTDVGPPWDAVLRLMSFTGHVGFFGHGEWRLSSTLFFVGLTAFFLHLAVGTLGRRRWKHGGRRAR